MSPSTRVGGKLRLLFRIPLWLPLLLRLKVKGSTKITEKTLRVLMQQLKNYPRESRQDLSLKAAFASPLPQHGSPQQPWRHPRLAYRRRWNGRVRGIGRCRTPSALSWPSRPKFMQKSRAQKLRGKLARVFVKLGPCRSPHCFSAPPTAAQIGVPIEAGSSIARRNGEHGP